MNALKFNTRYHNAGIENDPPQREEPSRTKQEFLEEADINTILSRYERHGLALPRGDREPMFGDFSAPELADYAQAFATVQGAQELMARLPAKVRDRFNNDPGALINFVMDKNNRDQALELGLIEAPPVVIPPGTVKTETLKTETEKKP